MLVSGFAPSLAHAQPAQPATPSPPVWSGKAAFSLVALTGNTTTKTISAGGELNYKPGVWSGLGRINFVRSTAEGVETARQLDATGRAQRQLRPRTDVYGQVDYLKNVFAGIENRVAPEAGIAYQVLTAPTQSLRVAGGIGYSRETRTTGPTLTFATANARLGYTRTLSDTADLTEEATFTSGLDRVANWRFANAVSLSAALTTLFSLKVSHETRYLKEPVPTFQKTDTVTSVALVAKF